MLSQEPSSAHIPEKCHLPSPYFAASTGQQNPLAQSFLISQHVLQKRRNGFSEYKCDPRKCQSILSSFFSHSWCYWQGRCLCFFSNSSKSLPAVLLMTCKALIRQWHTYKPLFLMTGTELHHHHPIYQHNLKFYCHAYRKPSIEHQGKNSTLVRPTWSTALGCPAQEGHPPVGASPWAGYEDDKRD